MDGLVESNGLRDRLIIAGIEEISLHGVNDFSLRRVATRCDASCAAPYKHFKNREDFIRAIVAYINSQWRLLADSVLHLYEGDTRRQLVELCVAYIRFLSANSNYRAALTASGETELESSEFSSLIESYCEENHIPERDRPRRLYAVKALMFGTVSMLSSGELGNDGETFDRVRVTLLSLLN